MFFFLERSRACSCIHLQPRDLSLLWCWAESWWWEKSDSISICNQLVLINFFFKLISVNILNKIHKHKRVLCSHLASVITPVKYFVKSDDELICSVYQLPVTAHEAWSNHLWFKFNYWRFGWLSFVLHFSQVKSLCNTSQPNSTPMFLLNPYSPPLWPNKGIPEVHSGLKNMTVLKTTQSGFEGFLRDRFTTLQDARDRCFCTSVYARWRYNRIQDVNFDAAW